MTIEWSDLQIFLAVERGGSARVAAQTLKCSHSTVSRRLAQLERQLGAALFDRTPEGLVLSASGARILATAQRIEAETFELERSVSGSDIRLQGTIRLTVPPPLASHLLLPHLEWFRATYPEIEIEVISTYANSDLSRRDADIAIRFSRSPDQHLVGRGLPPFRDAIYAAPTYISQHWGRRGCSAAWISWPDTGLFKKRVAHSIYAQQPIRWRLPTLTIQAEAARREMGMVLLPCLMGDRDAVLVRVPGSELFDGRSGWILTHPDLRRMERVRVFAKFLADAVQSEAKLVGGGAPKVPTRRRSKTLQS